MEAALIRIVGLAIALTIALLVRKDAKTRGMKASAWSVGVFLLMIIFLPLYFIMRKPKLDTLSDEEREEVLSGNEAESIQKNPEKEAYSSGIRIPDKYRFLPHLLVAMLWSLFSIWICVKEQEFISLIFLVFIGFLPFLLEKFVFKYSRKEN